MSEQVQRQRQNPPATPASDGGQAQASTRAHDSSLDDLLDSIDAVLETNAEEYVRSFVQKGGQ